MADAVNPVSLDANPGVRFSASALNAAGLKAISTSVEEKTAARKLERLLCQIGYALYDA